MKAKLSAWRQSIGAHMPTPKTAAEMKASEAATAAEGKKGKRKGKAAEND